MLDSLAVLLLAFWLIQLIAVLAAKWSAANRVWSAQRWSRRAHAHSWRPHSVAIYQGPESSVRTIVTEECRRCPAMRLQVLDGVWGLNRFGDLVNLAPEPASLRTSR